MTKRKGSGRHRGAWFCQFRANGQPAFIEQCENGWRIILGHHQIAVVASREIAIAVVDALDAKTEGGGGDASIE